MDNRGLLFIPDISGFTRFVNETEIRHCRLIIQELLEVLINANEIGLEISEIEGDAILFYKFGESPDLDELYRQVEKMFCAFHKHLLAYEHRRFCQCQACVAAVNLTLKVITHYGEFTGYNVKNFSKLIGKDVIVAHQLLKNDIEQHEYWLVTNNLLQDHPPVSFADWMQWNRSAKQTETGQVPFLYTQLSPLKSAIPPDPPPELDIADKMKMVAASGEYELELHQLFHLLVCFHYRDRWEEGTRAVDEISHHLPRLGTHYRCVLENGGSIRYATSSLSYSPEKVVFSETDEKKKLSRYYMLERISNQRTRLTVTLYARKNLMAQAIFQLVMKRKLEQELQQSLSKLGKFVKGMQQPAA